MNEQEKTFGDLTAEEMQEALGNAGSPDFHDLPTEDFFTALAALDEEADTETPRETLELRATVKDGQLSFLEPAPLHAHGNEIRLGDKRVVIQLVPEEAPV